MNQLYLVGMGPGNLEKMTEEARQAIAASDVVVGYDHYIELIAPLIKDQKIVSNGMRKEVDRCREAIGQAFEGRNVSVVSSGDAGVYGMAGLVYEILAAEEKKTDFGVKVIPGVTAANAAASVLGAPLMHDYVTISLSDLMTPWEVIEKRLLSAAQGDFIVAIYNPKSKKRSDYVKKAKELLMTEKSRDTVCGVVRNAGRTEESSVITTLEKLDEEYIDMFSTVIVGNSNTYEYQGKMITPRGYAL
ncbi:MAG TPA: precorrin-3B C(17)-methyltransferase [Eubacteriaceae bacterium]|nr:precorrin-3B C(17)-methyltransferase [Eubacteriaceae bacterium]